MSEHCPLGPELILDGDIPPECLLCIEAATNRRNEQTTYWPPAPGDVTPHNVTQPQEKDKAVLRLRNSAGRVVTEDSKLDASPFWDGESIVIVSNTYTVDCLSE